MIINAETKGTDLVANLLPPVYLSENTFGNPMVSNGITWTLNTDGSLTATGTATANSTYNINSNVENAEVPVMLIDPTKSYFLSGCPANGSSSTYRMMARYTPEGTTPNSSSGVVKQDIGEGANIPVGYRYIYVYCIIYSGYTCPSGGLTFYPMLEVGDVRHTYISTHNGTRALSKRIKNAEDELDAIGTVAYATCTTAAGTAAKVATVQGGTPFALKVGATVAVKYTNTNTAGNPTLNVNNTGAKSIWYNNAAITTSYVNTAGRAGTYITYMYDGTYWVFLSWGLDSNTTYSNATTSVAGLMSATDKTKLDGHGLYSGILTIPANGALTLDIPKNARFMCFTIPLTSGIDGWGMYGVTSQTQTDPLKYIKTLIACGNLTTSQSGGNTGDISINNSYQYAQYLLWIGNNILGSK